MSVADVLPLSPPATSSGSRKRPLPLFASKPSTSTPDDSPASELESSCLGSKKKVEFSPWADILQPAASLTSSLDVSSLKQLPPSRECQSYIKSILKSNIQDDRQPPGYDGPADVKLSVNEVMESIVQQLSKNDKAELIDAYQTLASTIKAYDEIPEEAVLKSKLNAIARQIRQHLGSLERPDPQPTDINLVTSALKVLVILVWSTDFAPLLNDDFRVFVLDKAIGVITEHTAPKSVIVHYLHLLATQDFRPGLLTASSRASRLIETLKDLNEHVKGNGVVSERLLVYQRLLDQARPIMKSKSNCWVEHMLSGMASSIADTRNKALALGRKACQAFPASSSISGSIRLALDLKQESGRSLGMSICRRLEKMVMGKDEAGQVPQIWAVILLLCNNTSVRIDAWQSLKEWLMVIQRCFNGSDAALRIQANSAWNRFVYVARPHEASDGFVAMLIKPVAAQLERTASDKPSKTSHAIAISSYCNLLYYAFRPATSHSQYNKAWNEYVVKIMRSTFFEKSSGNADVASRVLMSLFWDGKTITKVWNENRAHENRLVEPEELPTIDCKWIRNRCSRILEIFQVLFRYSSWGFPASSDQAYISKGWRYFLKAIREAGSKEIKTSNQTRSAVANILTFLTMLWKPQEARQKEGVVDPICLSREILTNISHMAVAELGVERVLDVLQSDPSLYSAWLFTVVFEMLKPKDNGYGKSDASMTKLLKAFNVQLELHYEERDRHYMEYCGTIEAASQMLFSMPRTAAQSGLEFLSCGLATWLRDEENYFSSGQDPEIEKSLEGSLKHLVDAFTAVFSLISPEHFTAFDSCLAAIFASSHSTVVSGMAQLWNSKLAISDEVEIGPLVTDAIKRLLPSVEIQLPSTGQVQETHRLDQRPPTYHTLFESVPRPETGAQSNILAIKEKAEPLVPVVTAEVHDSADQDFVHVRQGVREPTTSNPRYDDSQIQFVAIDSSPARTPPEDSQYLTHNQKEVRDRQRVEPAVVFPDFRSSPRPQSRRSESRDCGFARKAATMIERPTTPTLPDHNDSMDAEPEPSPTPKSRLLRELADVDVPSSPPSMPGASERRDVQMENVSSPMPDAAEGENRQADLGSPLILSTTAPVQGEIEAVAEKGPAHSHIPQAGNTQRADVGAELAKSVSMITDPTLPENDGSNKGDSIAEKPIDAATQVSMVAADVETPSSPPIHVAEKTRTPPQRSSSIFDTSELNELSASQLSHDLDWTNVLEGLDTPSTVSKSPLPVVQPSFALKVVDEVTVTRVNEEADEEIDEPIPPMDDLEPAVPEHIPKKRKRPQSGYAERKKRRKSSRSYSQSSSSQTSQFKQEEEELLDCIVVDTSSDYIGSSSPVHPLEDDADEYITSRPPLENEDSAQMVGGLKRRGRSRKRSQSSVKQEVENNLDQLRNVPEGAYGQRPAHRAGSRRSRQRLSPTASVEPESLSPSQHSNRSPFSHRQRALIPVVEVTAPTSEPVTVSGPVDTDVVRSVAATHCPSPLNRLPDQNQNQNKDIVANLNAVLEQIKTAANGSVDLRAVDELCFQIRFHAQHGAAMGYVNAPIK